MKHPKGVFLCDVSLVSQLAECTDFARQRLSQLVSPIVLLGAHLKGLKPKNFSLLQRILSILLRLRFTKEKPTDLSSLKMITVILTQAEAKTHN